MDQSVNTKAPSPMGQFERLAVELRLEIYRLAFAVPESEAIRMTNGYRPEGLYMDEDRTAISDIVCGFRSLSLASKAIMEEADPIFWEQARFVVQLNRQGTADLVKPSAFHRLRVNIQKTLSRSQSVIILTSICGRPGSYYWEVDQGAIVTNEGATYCFDRRRVVINKEKHGQSKQSLTKFIVEGVARVCDSETEDWPFKTQDQVEFVEHICRKEIVFVQEAISKGEHLVHGLQLLVDAMSVDCPSKTAYVLREKTEAWAL